MKTTLFISAVVSIVLLSACLERSDIINDQSQYCEMVSIWDADKAAGMVSAERAGWPPFRKDVVCL